MSKGPSDSPDLAVAMLDERERVEKVPQQHPPPEPKREAPAPSYRQWLHTLAVDELLELFSDPAAAAGWHEELRAEILELIRSKGGDQAVRRALGLHFDRPPGLVGRPDQPAEELGRRRDPWLGLAVARPGVRRAVDRVGRAFVEAALRWRWERLRAPEEGESEEAADARAVGGGGPLDLTAPFVASWPELVPPPLAEGVPGLTLDLAGPRKPPEPEARLLQVLDAVEALVGCGEEATRFVALFGHAERSDGRAAVFFRFGADGLSPDAAELALDEAAPRGTWIGRIHRLLLLTRPLLAYHGRGEEPGILVGPVPESGLPDPVRPGPVWVELGLPAATLTLRVHLSPEASAGVTGVLDLPRVLALLRRLTNRGFLPAGDPAARLPAPPPRVGRAWREGVAVTWSRRPGDALAAAELEGPPEAVAGVRAALAEEAGEDAIRAAALTEPDGPVPARPPGE